MLPIPTIRSATVRFIKNKEVCFSWDLCFQKTITVTIFPRIIIRVSTPSITIHGSGCSWFLVHILYVDLPLSPRLNTSLNSAPRKVYAWYTYISERLVNIVCEKTKALGERFHSHPLFFSSKIPGKFIRLLPELSPEILSFKSVGDMKTPRFSLGGQYFYLYTLTTSARHMTSVKVPRLTLIVNKF